MPAPSAPNFEPGKAIVISLARADDRGVKALVFCLDKSGMRDPFPLRNQDGLYIWPRKKLREIDIGVGSIISYERFSQGCLYSGNTGMKVVSLALQFVPKHASSYNFGNTGSIVETDHPCISLCIDRASTLITDHNKHYPR